MVLAALAGLAVGSAGVLAQDAGNPPPEPPPQEPVRPQVQPPAPQPGGEGDTILISEMSEPWELRNFVDYVASALSINIIASDQLNGSVVINAPMAVKRSELLSLLDAMLEQHGFTIIQDESGFYRVMPLDHIGMQVGTGAAPTQIIHTGGIKPTALQDTITKQLSGPDRPLNKISFIDDLGVIVITDSPRRIGELVKLVEALIAQQERQEFMRFDVEFIAASVARQRIIELLGGSPSGQPTLQTSPTGELQVSSPAGRLAALPERLTIDAQGNALIFRGTPEEAEDVEAVLAVIDVPNNLETRVYFAGSAATAIADIARSRGLAEIQEVQSAPAEGEGAVMPGMPRPLQPGQPIMPGMPGQQSQTPLGGPTMIVDTSRGVILYAATPAQHEQVAALIKEFDVQQDQIVVKAYQLQHADAEHVADLILSLLLNQESTASGGLLPGARGRQNRTQEQRERRTGRRMGLEGEGGLGTSFGQGGLSQPERSGSGGNTGGGEGDLYVIADPKNNQVLVKAPARLQPEFQRLIEKVDLRRPQVYIEAKIVAVNATKDFRLAFNYQLINADGEGGILNFMTGLGSFGEGGSITDPVNVSTSLTGITAALIRSDYVPVIITALQRNVDGRVLSSPQLLIDDNETATLVAVEQQPFSQSSQNVQTTETGFGGYEEAGTELTITPSISQGGYVRLAYEVSLSNFVGDPTVTAEGVTIPPIRLQNEVSSDSVTVPGDTTVVVGGLTVDTLNDTIVKVPLLGDIPIIGHLFRDTGKSNRQTTLYIFLTPKILREPSIPDLILLTKGPQLQMGIENDLPAIEPSAIEIFEIANVQPDPPTRRPRP